MYVLESEHLEQLIIALRRNGHKIIAPTIANGCIVPDEIFSANEIPRGWTDEQSPVAYRLDKRDDEAMFGYVVGPQSWKKFLYPPRLQLFTATKNGKGFDIATRSNGADTKYAFIGVRPCELSAIKAHDEIFCEAEWTDPHYEAIRRNTFIVAVNCTEPGGTCFCASMNTGPRAERAFDLSLTEVAKNGTHHFVVEVGSEAGGEMLKEIEHREAERSEVEHTVNLLNDSASRMRKSVDATGLAEILTRNYEHPEWDELAKRCLGCANCTMVCPTCFCSTVEDTTNLTGTHAERWRRWDSCFTADFTKIAGGNLRLTTRSRYRQWMMHKFAYWHEQFGHSGCVGCGRCITWCPVGIDITEEAARIRETSVSTITE